MTTPPWADVVIIGGGVVGLAVAYECARSGWRTVLLERDAVGSGAAGVAAGMLSPAAEADTGGEELLELAFESCRLYPEFVNAVEAVSAEPCGYRTEGSLLVALNRDHAEELERLTAFQRRSGIEVSWLDADAVLAREPALSPRVIGGLFAPGDRQVNPRRLMQALAVAITSLGSKIETGAAVLEIVTEGGRVSGVRHSSHGETSF